MSDELNSLRPTVSGEAATSTQNYRLFSKATNQEVDRTSVGKTCPETPPAQALSRIFEFGESKIRVIDQNGEPWFVAADVCRVLGLDQVTNALRRLDGEETTLISIKGASNGLPVAIVNESGLYSLILGSRKPEAKAFKRWVTGTVLPAIRKTGSYSVQPAAIVKAPPANYAECLRELAAEIEDKERIKLENERLTVDAKKNEPLIQFYHAVANSMDTKTLNETAKLLKMGRNRMMKEMRARGILMPDNVPYQVYLDRKYFRVTESKWEDPKTGETHIALTTSVYQRGIEFLRRRFTARPLVALPAPKAVKPAKAKKLFRAVFEAVEGSANG